ncbi:MAG: class I SAM-dependent methyltransferase [Moorea sp. SIOASIH]|uniref:class I SAM-dependent methyltransferase n=1 Tax=Moorena sp. SIOASIH TaxID=2607817 RepID=UPI0013B96CBF|nr:class I SAM-dependent methyltransferase [Moorena sp. SIOASIH]NEO38540.1 class I SAM-dependent methyltransferase [Moorena sp. SIOASIH]
MLISPLTGSNNVTLLKTIEAEQLIQNWKDSFQIDITEELKGHHNIYLYQCNETNLKFFAPFDVVGSGKLYEKLNKFDWYYMPEKWEYNVALRDLLECQNILEIGSGSGHFVKSIIDAGLNIIGIELNEAAVTAAHKKNLPVERLDLKEGAKLYRESLDGVCSFQVLEHVANPKDFIDWSIQMLKPGGKLIYCVPNSESFLKYQYNLLDMPPHHMLQWSSLSFKSLEKLFPIKLIKVVNEPLASYHVSSYIHGYNNHFSSVYPFGKFFFNRYTIPRYTKIINLGLRRFLTGQSLYVLFKKI